MKKIIGTSVIAITLISCTTSNKVTYNKPSDYYHETEAIHENLTEEEDYEMIASVYAPNCKNCDEID